MSKNNKLIVVKNNLKDIRYEIPKKADQLDKVAIKKINNAIGSGIVDSKGIVWFDCSKLHTIIRVKTKNDAAYILETIDNKFKTNYNNKTYIRWAGLVSILAKRIESNPKNEYLKVVFDIVNEINKSNDIKVLQIEANDIQKKYIKKLKKQRIDLLNIVKDELTNEVLDKKTAEFSHIRSVTMHPEVSEYIWNGLIVNKETHSIITSECINDEDQLYILCYKNKWNISWYNEYKEKIKLMGI